jgi:FkbM family methyltransferase
MYTAKQLIRAIVPRFLRNWLRSPARTVEWIWGEVKYKVGATSIVSIRPGWTLQRHPVAYPFAYRLQNEDPEQREEFDGFINQCNRDMVLVDVGAHFGLFSLAAIHYGGPGAKALAVDPSPTAARIMRIQAQLNQVADRLQIIEASVGEKNGWQNMVAVGVLAGGYFVWPTVNHSDHELTRTPEITLDQLCEDYKLVPTHIKIDVEGNEAAVLKGGQKILSQEPKPLLFIELHNQIIRDHGKDPMETIHIIRDLGFEIFSVTGTPLKKNYILDHAIIRVTARNFNSPFYAM